MVKNFILLFAFVPVVLMHAFTGAPASEWGDWAFDTILLIWIATDILCFGFKIHGANSDATIRLQMAASVRGAKGDLLTLKQRARALYLFTNRGAK